MTEQIALLIAVNTDDFDVNDSLDELEDLSYNAGAIVVGRLIQNREKIDNTTYVGKGKLDEVNELIAIHNINLLIFDDELTGMQLRNIEEATNCAVIDRTLLILDIFAMRATSNEGKLQVELAQERYLLPRLIGLGLTLSRQQGGIGSRGAGESKLETDRRHIRSRILSLERELVELSKRRELVRKRRKKNDVLTIAIVGYTNVGKSTLLNYLTNSDILTKDMLFATLDPTARELTLNDGQTAVIIDTVGFMKRLPHQLIKAFMSTLEEAKNADIILNVCDVKGNYTEQLDVTQKILLELDCGDIPTITVYNKVDGLDLLPTTDDGIYISAKTGQGIDKLLQKITEILSDTMQRIQCLLPYTMVHLLDKIRQNGKIITQEYLPDGVQVEAIIEKKNVYLIMEYMND